mgnify:CR=1 FL=1
MSKMEKYFWQKFKKNYHQISCLLYTSDAADERSSVDLGGRRIIKKKNNDKSRAAPIYENSITQQYEDKITNRISII